MTLEIPKEKWVEFFDDLSKRRFGWETKVEVLQKSVGDQILSQGLPLNGITFAYKTDEIEISVGEKAEQHQTHNIVNPKKVAFLSDAQHHGGVLEIEENNGNKTLIQIMNPMPVYVGYAAYQMVSTS